MKKAKKMAPGLYTRAEEFLARVIANYLHLKL